MTTPRTAYKLDTNNPGSDLAGETAAALAAASLAFKPYDSSYSNLLLVHAKQVNFTLHFDFTSYNINRVDARDLLLFFGQLFSFADRFRGLSIDSIPNSKQFYASSGYGVSQYYTRVL